MVRQETAGIMSGRGEVMNMSRDGWSDGCWEALVSSMADGVVPFDMYILSQIPRRGSST